MQITKKIGIVLTLTVMLIPTISWAQFQIAPECGANCGFPELIATIGRVINFFLLLSPILFVLGLMLIGLFILFNRGSVEKVQVAKQRAWKMLISFIGAQSVWVILRILVYLLQIRGEFLLGIFN